MFRHAAVLAALLLVPSDASAQAAQAAKRAHPTDGLAWLSGCWERRTPRATITEHWMPPAGGMMLGASRTVRGDSVVEYEHVRIAERGDTVVYHAMPSGQRPAEFGTTQVSDTLVAFDNPAHDFPQRILYRRGTADSLFARIEGTRNGQRRGVDFRYARVSCVAPASTSATRSLRLARRESSNHGDAGGTGACSRCSPPRPPRFVLLKSVNRGGRGGRREMPQALLRVLRDSVVSAVRSATA